MILVTLLGKEAKETDYELEGRVYRAPLAPIAIASLRKGFSEVVALCTEEAAKTSFPVLEQALGRGGISTRCESIELATSDQEIEPFLEHLTKIIDAARDNVALDITHGPRHLQFLLFAVALYLSALGRAQVVATYYGFLSTQGTSRIVDLQPLLELATLAFAAGELRRTGSTKALVERLRQAASAGVQVGRVNARQIKEIASQLEGLAEAFGSGLPLETGAEAMRFRQKYKKLLARCLRQIRVPLSDRLVEAIDEELADVALVQQPPEAQHWKTALRLDIAELERESRFVDALFARRAYGPAAIAAQEWIISWAIFLEHGTAAEWLKPEKRDRARNRLNALAIHASDPKLKNALNEQQAQLGRLWKYLREIRNPLAHAGMREAEVNLWGGKGELQKARKKVQDNWNWVKKFPKVPLDVPGTVKRLLVTPVGTVPGAFYSALTHARPVDCCLCICSAQTADLVEEVLGRSSYRPKPDVICLTLPDPHTDLDGARGLAKEARDHLARAEEVILNLTGGTTLMGLTVELIGDEARRLGRCVRRLIVVDRRPRKQQEQEPYVEGEAVWLPEGET